ncbi:hypothetical protein Ddc_16921 [Ditylenchus destructor]|nr:hypothetical protein Ddc_16921 [Ditylenchus destructor]
MKINFIGQLLDDGKFDLTIYKYFPTRKIPRQERNNFTYTAVNCPWSEFINGYEYKFTVCIKANLQHRALNFVEDTLQIGNRKAYFVGGIRDMIFENNFLRATANTVKIVLVAQKGELHIKNSDLVRVVFTNVTNVPLFDPNRRTLRLKEIADKHNDFENIEYWKYDLGDDSARHIFSLLTALPVCQMLVKLADSNASYENVRYIMKRLSYNLMYLYANYYHSQSETYYLSFIHKFCLERYGASDPVNKIWVRND